MKNLRWIAPLAAAMALGVASPALSHHSHAMFDHSKPATVTGTVKEFVFRNPHVYLYLDVKNDRGEVVTYWIEMSNIQNMIKQGINQATLKVGEVVTVRVHPLRDGRPGGNYETLTTADGRVFGREPDTN
jgi:Family of unknown function (DUF6152)